MTNTKNTSNLVNALKNGDQKAFKVIYDSNYRKLMAYINSFTKDEFETDDILQETFIKLWNSREKLDVVNSINGFLYKTAYYTYIDKYRKEKREQKTLDSWKYKRLMDAIVEDDEISNNRIEKLKLAIEKLPTKCKEVFVLCKYEKMTHAQIAESLNISPKTVQAHMCKAYNLIREKFSKEGFLTLFFYFAHPKFNIPTKIEKLMHRS